MENTQINRCISKASINSNNHRCTKFIQSDKFWCINCNTKPKYLDLIKVAISKLDINKETIKQIIKAVFVNPNFILDDLEVFLNLLNISDFF